MRMLKITLPNGKVKYDGSQDMAPKILAETTRIGKSLAEVSPAYNAAWNGRIKCTTGTSLNAQEHEAMKEMARKLYGVLSQDGEPPLTMMQTMVGMMEPMNFKVTKEAAKFAAEASIQHLCAVANLIKTCCLEGAAYDLVTDLGPERFTEWKAALINQAAGQVPNLFRQLEEEVRKGIVEPDPDRGALAHRQLTPGYNILKLVYTYMVQLRVVLKDLRRAELAAAIEADRVKAAARGATVAPAQYGQPATRDGDRRASGADTHRAESKGNLAERPPDPEPDDSEGTEAMVEADEQENMTALQAGLERAARQEEEAIEAHADYIPNTEIGAEAQAQAYLAHQGARAEVEAQAGEAHQAAKRQHHKDYAQAMKDANAWRASIVASTERKRRSVQRGKILEAIENVQREVATQRKDGSEPDEDLLNDTVTNNWLPYLFDGMLSRDAHPDVKRMALEAADKANINQVYPAGAGRQQWEVFVQDYRIRQVLWIRDNPTKVTGGTQRQPAAAATTVGRYEVGCPKHMRGWECTNPMVAAGGTACVERGRQPQPEQHVRVRRRPDPGET